MRILSFDDNGVPAIGVRLGEEVVNLRVAAPDLPQSLKSLLLAGEDCLTAAQAAAERAGHGARLPLEKIRHLVPIPDPHKNIGLGKNYLQHIREMNMGEAVDMPPFPGMFLRSADSMVAHNQPIWRPEISDTLDYEGELLVVIGREGRMIPKEDALSYVAGYSVHNDGSVREYNRMLASLTAGKNFMHTGGFGPEIVTANELPPGCSGLQLRTYVNGELRQDANIDQMHWDVAELVHLMSRIFTLYPGDIIGTGTPPGVGAGFNPPRWLQVGDEVRVSIEVIGDLVNGVIDAPRVRQDAA
jgi:2-keto-4-pentenoate hydratase/2-oxohepta-3-ene-1,7-dioic acid hydratase in catechol pathway